jgi:uridylate kinase
MRYMVIKIGGSLLSPKDSVADEVFLRKLVEIIQGIYSNSQNNDLKIVLVVGGGDLSRKYRDIAISVGDRGEIDQHRIGIVATWMNSELLRILLDTGSLVYKRTLGIGVFANSLEAGIEGITSDFNDWKNGDKSILVSGGFVNGASTDLNAFVLASKLETDKVYKLSNIDHVYTDDPSKNPNATPIDDMTTSLPYDLTWDEYLKMFEVDSHKPGLNVPVDILGAKLAKDNGITLCFMDGRDPSVITNIVSGEEIKCTTIH